MILDDFCVEGAACSRMLPRVGGNKDGTCTPSAAFSKARKTSESETNDLGNFKFAPLLFDPFLVVVFEVVVVIFYAKASDVRGKVSGEISIDFPSLVCPHYFGANDENERKPVAVADIKKNEGTRTNGFFSSSVLLLRYFRIVFLTLLLLLCKRERRRRRWGKNASPPSTCARKCPA